jgi:nucleoside-diphosphate-sugar epimerase
MVAFLTGPTGFLGNNLLLSLLKKGYSVRCLVRDKKKAGSLPEDVEVFYGDITDPKSLNPNMFKGVDVVFHVAGLISSHDISRYYKVNFEGTKNLVRVILESGRKLKFIYTSTLASVGPGRDSEPIREDDIPHPVDDYGKSKRKAEDFLLTYKNILNVVILRPTAIYGPLDLGFMPLFQLAFKVAFPLIPKVVFSLVHVSDVVKAHILSAEKDVISGQAYHLSDGKMYNFEEIFELLNSISFQMFSKKIRKIVVPRKLMIAFANFLKLIPASFKERLPFEIVSYDTLLRLAQKNWYCTYEKAERELGFQPDFEAYEGLKSSIMWYREKRFLT